MSWQLTIYSMTCFVSAAIMLLLAIYAWRHREAPGAAPDGDGHVRFWVQDNGPGLSPEEQAQLFAEFARLHQVRAEGHGLGLSIVQRIVKKLDGDVGVTSEPGAGSTFWFTLPSA
jgi:signal transduction histidine kinase